MAHQCLKDQEDLEVQEVQGHPTKRKVGQDIRRSKIRYIEGTVGLKRD